MGVKPAPLFQDDAPEAAMSAPSTYLPLSALECAMPCKVMVVGAVVASAASPKAVITL